MDTSIVDILVHVDEVFPPDYMAKLEDSVRGDECVVSASVSQRDPHLICVTYNPACTTSAKIVQRITSQGVRAEAIGL